MENNVYNIVYDYARDIQSDAVRYTIDPMLVKLFAV